MAMEKKKNTTYIMKGCLHYQSMTMTLVNHITLKSVLHILTESVCQCLNYSMYALRASFCRLFWWRHTQLFCRQNEQYKALYEAFHLVSVSSSELPHALFLYLVPWCVNRISMPTWQQMNVKGLFTP